MENKFKTFHFKEINSFISFPAEGNNGKYADYEVVFVKGDAKDSPLKKCKLHEVFDLPLVEQNFPHTIGYFKMSYSGGCSKPEYLELREVRSVEEFWAFLNAVNL